MPSTKSYWLIFSQFAKMNSRSLHMLKSPRGQSRERAPLQFGRVLLYSVAQQRSGDR
jgi:hypothetical protein